MAGAIVDGSMMDVYLVPVGPQRYELYCEVPEDEAQETGDADPADEDPGRGVLARLWFRLRTLPRRMRDRFRDMLAEAERERRQAHSASMPSGWFGRVRARTMRWVAESIAEQRLLWHLRRQVDGCLYYPDDLAEADAHGLLRSALGKDFDKHRFWLIIDSLGFIASGALMLVPGPNLLAYYFAFRLVGHYFSLRGARAGLSIVAWRFQPTAPLTELRRAIELDPAVRERQVHDVASRLRLEHLATFFERAAIPAP